MLKIENLHVSYGVVKVLHGISLEIRESEIVCILGPNGAGKTTLLNTISGILKPTEGKIIFNGVEIQNLSPSEIVKLGIVQVPEGRRVFTNLTVRENLLLGTYSRKDKKNIKSDLEKLFSLFPRLKERENQLAGTLSGGEQQILALARAIITRPKLLLLDEPSLGLSPKSITALFKLIRSLKDEGFTVCLAEQNAKQSLLIADRGYVIVRGEILLQGEQSFLLNSEEVKHLYFR